jgi:hypothetical protein
MIAATRLFKFVVLIIAAAAFIHETVAFDFDSAGYMYLHCWGDYCSTPCLSDMDIYVPAEVDKPLAFDVRYNFDMSFAAYISADNALFATVGLFSFPLCFGCRPSLQYQKPEPLNAGINETVSPYSIRILYADFPNAVFKIAAVTDDMELSIISINGNEFQTESNLAVSKIDTLVLSVGTGIQKILSLWAKPGLSGKEELFLDDELWAVGTGGLIRKFVFTNGVPSAEAVLDLPIEDTILSCGDGYFGTISGAIYQLNFASPEARPCSTALWAISSKGAVSDNGTVLEHTNGRWERIRLDSADYRYIHFQKTAQGLAAETLDRNWKYRFSVYRNEPTVLTMSSSSNITHLGQNTYLYEGSQQEFVSFKMHDPDQNAEAAAVLLCKEDSCISMISVKDRVALPGGRSPGGNRIPDEYKPCVGGMVWYVNFNDSIISLHLQPESIGIGAVLEYGIPQGDPAQGYYPCLFSTSPYDSIFQWAKGDSIKVHTSRDTFILVNSVQSSVAYEKNKAGGILPSKSIPQSARFSTYDILGRRMPDKGFFGVNIVIKAGNEPTAISFGYSIRCLLK